MNDVWTVELEGYDERTSLFGVYSSMDGAIADLKSFYGSPYVVDWLEPKETWCGFDVTGRFDAVQGFSSKHSKIYHMRKWGLDESWQDRKRRYTE